MHDMGMIAVTRTENGKEKRGFDVYVGGGLGAVPYQAKLFDSFVPPEELLPLAQAIARVFARLGEKKNRSRARIKFLVQDLGIEKFKELVLEERKTLPHDPRWTDIHRRCRKVRGIASASRRRMPAARFGILPALDEDQHARAEAGRLRRSHHRASAGRYYREPIRSLADIARRFTKETIRSTVEQNIVLRWISQSDLPEVHKALEAAGLGDPGAGSIVDIVTCPGTDTCKLGISSSRGLAAELRKRLAEKNFQLDDSVVKLHIKISGCFNSCGQHHVADLGFYGVSRKMSGYAVPHFQVVLGGEWENNGASYGLPVIAIPSKNIPEVVSRLTDRYAANRKNGESFKDFIRAHRKSRTEKNAGRSGAPAGRSLRPLVLPAIGAIPANTRWRIMGMGECAGEVVSSVEFDLAAAERELFEAQVAMEGGQIDKAGQTAYRSMVLAAKALVKIESSNIADDPAQIVKEFRARFYDTQKFFDPFAGGKFAHYLFDAQEKAGKPYTQDSARYLIDESQLFIDAAHSCYNRISAPAPA